MSVAEYYAQRAIEGRAVLGGSTAYEPPTWISRATAHGQVSYWLCRRDEFAIEQLEADRDVDTIRSTPMRQPRSWHRQFARAPFQLTA